MVYPNGRTIDYNYSGTNQNSALDNAIGRLDSISDGTNSGDPGQVLEQYSYLGSSTIVARNHPQTGINLTLLGSAGSIGSGGDQYVGLDRFGRIVDQNWKSVSSGQSVDNFTYSYDANSNVTAENNLLNTAYSQAFTYDPLNRLAASTLGGVANQSWNLDSQGNWSSFTSNGTTQTQTANAQNQIMSISGTSATPTYDGNGNTVSMGLTTQPAGSVSTLVYDAWNRLVAVKNSSGQVIAQYTYDARGYRVSETYPQGGTGIPAGEINYIYYDSQWQAIETRTNGTANSNVTSQMVWSAVYTNAAVLQDTYSGGVIQPNSRIYFLQDANWDTTAVVGYNSPTGTWGVMQRYVYSPYGTITVLNADWSTPPAGTQPTVSNLYQGMTLDSVTGLYYARNRNYSPSLGRWINQDPAGYINGANTYQFVMSNPAVNTDASGLGGGFYNFGPPPPFSAPVPPAAPKKCCPSFPALVNAWKAWLAGYQKAKMAYSTLVLDYNVMRSDEIAFSTVGDTADNAQGNLQLADLDLLALRLANLAADIPGVEEAIQTAEIHIKFIEPQVSTITNDANSLYDTYIKAGAQLYQAGVAYNTLLGNTWTDFSNYEEYLLFC